MSGWLNVSCPETRCNAQVDEPCRNLATGLPLRNRPAHERRLWNAEALGCWEPPVEFYNAHEEDPWAA